MVPSARVELARVSPQDSKSCVYTSFTTKARPGVPEGSRTLNLGFGTPHYIRLLDGKIIAENRNRPMESDTKIEIL